METRMKLIKFFIPFFLVIYIMGFSQATGQQPIKEGSLNDSIVSKIPTGQVKGILYDMSGKCFEEGISVFVVKTINDETENLKIQADLTHKTNIKGEFFIEGIEEGRYVLGVFISPKEFNPEKIILGLPYDKNEKPIFFSISPNALTDLGKITVKGFIK